MQIEEIDDIPEDQICCWNCRFFEKRNCFCRFNPPVPMVVNISGIQVTTSNYPKISMPNLDWCGKFEKINE